MNTPIDKEFNKHQDLEYYQIYFGKDAEYYTEILNKYTNGVKITANIWAFLFGFLWLVYKKLYKQAFIFMAIQLAFNYTLSVLVEACELQAYQMYIDTVSLLVLSLGICLIGNLLYIKQAIKTVEKVKSEESSTYAIQERLAEKGGSNFASVIIVILLFVIISLLFGTGTYSA